MLKIIAPLAQHDIISKKLDEDNKLFNTSIVPLSVYVQELVPQTNSDYDNNLRDQLLNLEDKLISLNTYVSNSTFIKSIKDFHISMHLYDISVEDLESNTLKDQDLKLIFNSIQNLIPQEISLYNDLKNYLETHKLSNTVITKQHLSMYDQKLVDLLTDAGLELYEDQDYETSNVKVYYENNVRSEIEASAQLIVNNKLSNAQVIVLSDDYLPIIKQTYDRYNIKNSLDFTDDNKNYTINFISILNLLEIKDEKSVIKFLSSNPFNLKNIESLIMINDLFKFDLHSLLNFSYEAIHDPIIHQSNLDHYNQTAQKAVEPLEILKEILSPLLQLEGMSRVETLFNYMLENFYSSELNSIKNTIMNNKDTLNQSDDLASDLSKLLLRPKTSVIHCNDIVITSARDNFYFDKEHVIILGSTIKNFPILEKLSGVIDEVYVSNLNYPKKSERFSSQLKQLDSIKKGENIYIFYPLSSYDGKAIEPSFSLLNFAGQFDAKPQRYNLLENDKSEYRDYSLDPELAKQLFFKDGQLSGSISSFEQYNSCGYAYFLQHGLKLYPKVMPELSFAYIGSVTHAVIEQLVNNTLESDHKLSTAQLSNIINDLFEPLNIFNDYKTNVIKLTLIKQLNEVVNHLSKIDKDTSFKPTYTEYKFNYDINDNMNVYGFIDRIDEYKEFIRVIDYKSSRQILSESDFKRGLQLQLITYLMAVSENMKKQPAGAFYVTTRILDSNIVPARVTKSKDFYYRTTDEEIKDNVLSANRINGWHFNFEDDFYYSNEYVGSLRLNKDKDIVVSRMKNFDTVETIIKEIYSNIYNDLSKGNIDCHPVGEPCRFCQLHNICLSKTTNNHRDMIHEKQKLEEEFGADVDK